MKLRQKTNLEIYKENNLKVNYLSNIIEEESTKNQIKAALEIIAKTVIGTLGPYGSNTIIQDRERRHLVSKDGYDLISRLSFDSEVASTVLEFIRQIASNQVLTVGDGSTSAVVVANALYSALTNKENEKKFLRVASKDIIDILKDITERLTASLKSNAIPLSDGFPELDVIAGIALNNDLTTGKFIADIYKKVGQFGFLSTEVLSNTENDEVEIKNGIEWQRGYIDPLYGKNLENGKLVYDSKPRIAIFNSELVYDDIEPLLFPIIQNSLNQKDSQLIIVALEYDEDVKNFLKANRQKHMIIGGNNIPMNFTPVDIDNVTLTGRNNIEDLAVLAKCEVYDKTKNSPSEMAANPFRFIGNGVKAIITKKTTQIIFDSENENKLRDKKIKEFTEELKTLTKKEIPTKEEEEKIFELRRRISNMTNSTAIVKVGGKTLSERMNRERLIEDAIYACKSAIKYGYIPGGNIEIPIILNKDAEYYIETLSKKYNYLPIDDHKAFFKFFINMLKEAFLESYRNVLNNSYFTEDDTEKIIERCLEKDEFFNLKTHKYEKITETSVINSVQTDIEILNSTMSIVSLLSSSNQILTLNLNALELIK